MARTLSQILTDANSFLDLEAVAPTGTELNVRSNFADQAVWDAAVTAQFQEFTVTQDVATPTVATSLTTVSLTNYREFEAVPSILGDPSDNYIEIKARERNDQEIINNITKYCYVLGNPREGYNAVFNNLTPNKTLTLTYQRFPTGFATLTDICELPDPTFVTSKIESYVLQSRGDERFPFVNTTAEQKLANMVGRESKRPGGGINETPKPVSPLG